MKNTREKGSIGEEIACEYLKEHGYFVQDRNYLKKWGEIDIVAIKGGILQFVEVKSVVDRGVLKNIDYRTIGYRPEENVHELKIRKLRRVIQTYLNDKKYGLDVEFKFNVITVRFNESTGESVVMMLEDLIL